MVNLGNSQRRLHVLLLVENLAVPFDRRVWQEAKALVAAGYERLRLGPRVLRTETAGIAAIAALQALCGDLG